MRIYMLSLSDAPANARDWLAFTVKDSLGTVHPSPSISQAKNLLSRACRCLRAEHLDTDKFAGWLTSFLLVESVTTQSAMS